MEAEDEPVLTETQMADLSALADGTLAPARRPAVEALIASSPELRERFELERGIVERLHAARATDRAPEALRTRIQSQQTRGRARRPAGRGRRWLAPWPAAGLSGAVAAVGAALLIALGGSGGLTVSSAAQVAQRGPAQGAPPTVPGNTEILTTHVGAVHFPARLTALGLTATGVRTDRIGGQRVVTVYYGGHGSTVSFSILSKPALDQEVNWTVGTVQYYDGTIHGRAALVWRNQGHTCIISSAGLSSKALRALV